MEKKTQFSIWYFALALLAVVFLRDVWIGARSTAPIPYSEFQTLVKEGKVADIAITDNQREFVAKVVAEMKAAGFRVEARCTLTRFRVARLVTASSRGNRNRRRYLPEACPLGHRQPFVSGPVT